MTYSAASYQELRDRIEAVLISTTQSLRADTVTFVVELLEANELGVALETIVEELAEAEARSRGRLQRNCGRSLP